VIAKRPFFLADVSERDRLTIGAILLLAAWSGLAYLAPGQLHGIPALAAGTMFWAAYIIGVSAARMPPLRATADAGAAPRSGSGPRPAVATVLFGIALVGAGTPVSLAQDGPLGMRLLLLLEAALLVAAGAWCARRWPTISLARFLLVGEVIALWVVADTMIWSSATHFYDFNVYLAAGVHAGHGQPVYLPAPITTLPRSAATDWFLYPPPLIPLLRLATHLPAGLAAGSFAVAMGACGLAAYRVLGLSWRWAIFLLAFPPMAKGIESGNVANLTFLLLVAGVRWGPALVVGTLFKVQNVIPAAWLVRERRWRDLLVGVALVGAVCLLTLPLVGIQSWSAWLAGLGYRQQSQVKVPILFGNSLALIMPTVVFVAVSATAVIAALAQRGRRGLAGLGLASIVASPSLWLHGFVMGIPALLAMPATAVWLALGAATIGGLGLWAMFAIAAVGLVAGAWESPLPADPLHPLGGRRGPWPDEADLLPDRHPGPADRGIDRAPAGQASR
jgi:hypothetical protein